MAHKKALGSARAQVAACGRSSNDATVAQRTRQHRYARYAPVLELRYPLQAAADSLAQLQWDHDQAGGHQQLAEALGVHRTELLEHRWRLRVLLPLETYHCPEVRHG